MTAVLANSQNSEHICPICNAKYNNVGNFKQHMKSHDTEQFREQRNAILSEMIATSYSMFIQLIIYVCTTDFHFFLIKIKLFQQLFFKLFQIHKRHCTIVMCAKVITTILEISSNIC